MKKINKMWSRRTTKFNNKKVKYNGVLYDSILESEYAQYLDLLKKGKVIKGWDRQIPILLIVNGIKISKLIADFVVTNNDKTLSYKEIKSPWTAKQPVFRLKYKLLKALYPELDYMIVETKEIKNLK